MFDGLFNSSLAVSSVGTVSASERFVKKLSEGSRTLVYGAGCRFLAGSATQVLPDDGSQRLRRSVMAVSHTGEASADTLESARQGTRAVARSEE